VPLPQVDGAPPPRQVTLQLPTPVQVTWHEPVHSTSQVVIPLQVTALAGPTRTPHRSTDVQSYWQRAPQMAPHETVLWHEPRQSSPHEVVQSFMSEQECAQPAPQTAPQCTIE
jgi:hypothetical protein